MRVFLDANILFSAAKSDGAVRALLRLLEAKGHTLVADAYVATEARRNLQAKGADAIGVLEALLARVEVASAAPPATEDQADEASQTRWLPEKDRPVLRAAIRLRCDALATGDRTHFGAGYGKRFGGVIIHSPSSLAEQLLR